MPDIRKMLEKQLDILQEHSEIMPEGNAPSENTYAMLAIIEVLYPDGIPDADKVGGIKTSIKLDGKEIAIAVIKELEKRPEPIRTKLLEEIVEEQLDHNCKRCHL